MQSPGSDLYAKLVHNLPLQVFDESDHTYLLSVRQQYWSKMLMFVCHTGKNHSLAVCSVVRPAC